MSENQIIGFPEGDYLKVWRYPNGTEVSIGSQKDRKTLGLNINNQWIGRLDRENVNIFVENVVQGGLWKEK